MALRKFTLGTVTGLLVLTVVAGLLTRARADKTDDRLSSLIRQAERILVASPEKDLDVPGGDQFLVVINRVLRGSGKKDTLARIMNGGEKGERRQYKKGQQYLFLLKKNAADKGWIDHGTVRLTLDKDTVSYTIDGQAEKQIPLEEFEELISRYEFSADAAAERESPAGRWVVALSQRGADFYLWLVDISKDDAGKYSARLIEASKAVGASTLKESSITDDEIHLLFVADSEKFDFRGKFTQGVIRGTMAIGETGSVISAARLLGLNVDSLKKYAEPQPSPGRDAFIDAASQQSETAEQMIKFVDAHKDSPLALDAFQMLVSAVKVAEFDEAKFKKIAEDYVAAAKRWGPRLELRAAFDIGVTLSRTGLFPEMAREYLSSAEKQFTDDSPGNWKQIVRGEKGKQLLAGEDPREGLAILEELRKASPFDPDISWALAQHAEKNKDIDAALPLYAELTILPQMEQSVAQLLVQSGQKPQREQMPHAVLERLWKQKHGDTKGLQEYVEKLYEESLKSIAGKHVAPRANGTGSRVVLCELFTGAECPPCVAADVATTALESTFAKSEVIVLRYHQHIPGPDPLANDDSMERFDDYKGQGTPSLYVNGKPFDDVGGFMPQVPDIYRRLKDAVEPYLVEKTDLKIDLTAKAEKNKIVISAKVSGDKKLPEEATLKLVLAEDRVPFVAGNGIRVHEMIVRAMPGGPDGIEPQKGKLAYTGEIDMSKLRTDLSKQLAKIESEMNADFPEKPMEFGGLHLVAFVQDDDSDDVLQAAAVPVTGKLELGASSGKGGTGTKAPRGKAPPGNQK